MSKLGFVKLYHQLSYLSACDYIKYMYNGLLVFCYETKYYKTKKPTKQHFKTILF